MIQNDDTISRQAAIDAVLNNEHSTDITLMGDAFGKGYTEGYKEEQNNVLQYLADLPSAQPEPCEDFVKVVRCKKCRYVHCDKEFDNYWCNRMSGTFMVEAEGFCKWGR